ncbi:hypothetical protein H2248_005210 [Termitomyces sp. 'cryptogamus']|nr:hypothetical protein H2248_005210 [Termitomyces sp. 'cryptogamus']
MDGNVSGSFCLSGAMNLNTLPRGFGQFMAGTPMVIMWPNGNDVVLSQRKAPAEVMPTVDPNPPRIATLDNSLTSLSGDKPSFGFTIPANSDTTQFIIMAFGIDLPGSSDPGATLRQHFEFKMVTLDLTKGSSTTPTSDSSAASPTKTSPAGHRTNPADDIPLLQYQRMIVAHGIFLTVAFLLLLPGGALLARYLRTFTPTWFLGHTIAQFWLSGPVIIVGIVFGILAVSKSGALHLDDNHKRLGVAIFVLYISQVVLGAAIHWIKPRNSARRPTQNYAHAVFGLLIIAIAMFQVHDGFTSEWQRTTGREGLSGSVIIFYYVWIGLITVSYSIGLVLLPKQFRQEKQPKRFSMSEYPQYRDADTD